MRRLFFIGFKLSLIITFIISLSFSASAESENNQPAQPIVLDAEKVGEALAAASSEQNQNWRFSVTPVVWLPGITGTFVDGPFTLEFEKSTSERVSELTPGGEIFLELSNGKWSFVLQPAFSDISMDATLKSPYGELPGELRAETLALNFWGAHRWSGQNAWIEILVGGQVLDMKVKTKTLLGTDKKTVDWVDPMLGLRGQYQIAKKWQVEGLVTAAGFDLSDTTSEENYETRLGVKFTPNDSWNFMLGYRTIDTTNKEKESTENPEKLKTKLRGPFISLGYKFK